MPIYEFACPDCRKIFSFLSKRLQPAEPPACPKCGRRKMIKQFSSFATPRGRQGACRRPRRRPGGRTAARPGRSAHRARHVAKWNGTWNTWTKTTPATWPTSCAR